MIRRTPDPCTRTQRAYWYNASHYILHNADFAKNMAAFPLIFCSSSHGPLVQARFWSEDLARTTPSDLADYPEVDQPHRAVFFSNMQPSDRHVAFLPPRDDACSFADLSRVRQH